MKKETVSPCEACEQTKTELIVKDFQKDLKRCREIRNLANRIYQKDGSSVFQNDYTLLRFWQSVVWYIKKAKWLKFWFFFYSTLAIVLPILTTLLNTTLISSDIIPEKWKPYCTLVVSVLSAVTAVISALLSLFKFQHRWIQCRYTAESLQKELSLFVAGANDYSDDNFTASGVKHCEQPPAEPQPEEQPETAEAESDDNASNGKQPNRKQSSAQATTNDQQSATEHSESAKPLKKSALAKMKEDYFLFKMEQIMANEQTQWYNLHKPSKDK